MERTLASAEGARRAAEAELATAQNDTASLASECARLRQLLAAASGREGDLRARLALAETTRGGAVALEAAGAGEDADGARELAAARAALSQSQAAAAQAAGEAARERTAREVAVAERNERDRELERTRAELEAERAARRESARAALSVLDLGLGGGGERGLAVARGPSDEDLRRLGREVAQLEGEVGAAVLGLATGP